MTWLLGEHLASAYAFAIGCLIFLSFRLSKRPTEANFALFILLSAAIPGIFCAALEFLFVALVPERHLILSAMTDVATWTGPTFAVASVVPRLRRAGWGFGGGLTAGLCAVQGNNPSEPIAGLAVAYITTLLLYRAFRRFQLLPSGK